MTGDRVVQQYLGRYAERAAAEVCGAVPGAFDSALVVPAYDEVPQALSHLLAQAPTTGRRLLILVVNERQGSPPSAQQNNRALIQSVFDASVSSTRAQGTNLSFHEAPLGRSGMNVLLIDSTQPGSLLGPKEGVGRARKMGMDAALHLFATGRLASPFCGSSDADVHLPQGYFESLEQAGPPLGSLPEESGLLFPYRHLPDPHLSYRAPMQEVELSFRYYVLGLASAGSPYAYHALGSALSVSLPHYARVRGVPNRRAGEDFYLLSKLSKLGPLRRLPGPFIQIETRLSDRVPFGTGPSLRRATEEISAGGNGVRDYNPDSFRYLRTFLGALNTAVCAKDFSTRGLSAEMLSEVPSWVRDAAQELWLSLRPHLEACPTSAHRQRRLHEKFDALATLQFIHRAHREGLSQVELCEALVRLGLVAPGTSRETALLELQGQEEGLSVFTGIPAAL